jgi:hypothetical protein
VCKSGALIAVVDKLPLMFFNKFFCILMGFDRRGKTTSFDGKGKLFDICVIGVTDIVFSETPAILLFPWLRGGSDLAYFAFSFRMRLAYLVVTLCAPCILFDKDSRNQRKITV